MSPPPFDHFGRPPRGPGIRRKGKFDPNDKSKVRHSTYGVWDMYEETYSSFGGRIPLPMYVAHYLEVIPSMPYVWRMIKDIASIREAWPLFVGYLVLEFFGAFLPALSLWYSGQLLDIVRTAVETRTVDTDALFRIASGRFACAIGERLVRYGSQRLAPTINKYIKQYYAIHLFHALSRLDLPTFEDSAIQRQIQQSFSPDSRSSIAWDAARMSLSVLSTVVRLLSQLVVLMGVLREQRDGMLLALLSFAHSLFSMSNFKRGFSGGGVWAATTKDDDYVTSEGLKKTVSTSSHRKELVAGGMWQPMLEEFAARIHRMGTRAGDFFDVITEHRMRERLGLGMLLQEPLKELPQIVFTLRAVQYPASIPLSLASLNLITQTTSDFTMTLYRLFEQSGSIVDKITSVRRLYELVNIPNRIEDGTEPYPEDASSLRMGVSVEFRNVSFCYPGSTAYALRNVSFKINQGQLCVVVGKNGSGKSTILKLICRLYDPTEGEIFIDGREIRTLKLDDLRRAMSVLFQDYTHFPLSIRENIGYGDPENRNDIERIRESARLGGAEEFIDKLDDGFDTYLDRPVNDYYAGLPEGTTSLFGRPVTYTRMRGMGRMAQVSSTGLSGGQMQRIALSRTFMRSVDTEARVGLLLFDEPSASLDPTAEHGMFFSLWFLLFPPYLFERLRKLRGQKSMIFSSHRFGNLTRHADIILYMNDAAVVEEGTHAELIEKGGEYARIWNLQAQAFIS
ncbi:P-loop containing nucleoside triphosphate hydrolase protein [Fistulina hepatica ATCC 64428]|uniref:p-loop containing nucleoside triphosphate hydrolase protein n=1 Tax=Fistulina hepatica ATCC 64428 TaxID=1128425 RepID=A0A0D7A3T3_9AGAR|nr:P-loop containing nucleoside triphosphate hydrolase protein [Fistulina hepatica ATCC 64428]